MPAAARSLLTLARPRMLPLVLLVVACGYGLGHWELAQDAVRVGDLALVMAAWALLHAGSLWLNARLDQDEGAVLFGATAQTPAVAGPAGAAALVGCVVVAAWADPRVGAVALLAAILAALYSHPRVAWKGHALGGPLVNAVGYGLLSPLAGWLLVRSRPDGRTVALLAIFALSMLSLALLAQVGQGEEDAARGYRTLVAREGDAAALRGARVSLACAAGAFGLLAATGLLPRFELLVLPLLVLVDRRVASVRGAAGAGRAVVWLFGVALVALAVAVVHHLGCLSAGGPVAGQCTAVVPVAAP